MAEETLRRENEQNTYIRETLYSAHTSRGGARGRDEGEGKGEEEEGTKKNSFQYKWTWKHPEALRAALSGKSPCPCSCFFFFFPVTEETHPLFSLPPLHLPSLLAMVTAHFFSFAVKEAFFFLFFSYFLSVNQTLKNITASGSTSGAWIDFQ